MLSFFLEVIHEKRFTHLMLQHLRAFCNEVPIMCLFVFRFISIHPFLLLYLRLFFVMLHSYALTSRKYNGYLENHLFLYFISAPELIITIACEQQRALITSSAGRVFLCPRARFETNREEVRRESQYQIPCRPSTVPCRSRPQTPPPSPLGQRNARPEALIMTTRL